MNPVHVNFNAKIRHLPLPETPTFIKDFGVFHALKVG